MVKRKQILHIMSAFLVVILVTSRSMQAMDNKHSVKGQEASKSQGDQKTAFDRKRTAVRTLAVQPSFAGRLHTLRAASRQGEGKALTEQQPRHNSIRLLNANPASDVPRIAPLNWAIDDSLKIKVFGEMAKKVDTKTEALYRLAHDPIIKKHLHDAKTFYEYNSLKDADGKTILDHAIAHDDAPFIGPLVGNLTTDERHKAIRAAASQKKLRALLALVPKVQGAKDEIALLDHFKNIDDLTVAEIEGYQQALLLAQKHRGLRDSYTKKVIQKIAGNTNSLLSRLPADIHLHIQDMICLAGDGHTMHPELEDAVKKGDQAKIDRLIKQGCDVTLSNSENKNALELADDATQITMLVNPDLLHRDNRIKLLEAIRSSEDPSLSAFHSSLTRSDTTLTSFVNNGLTGKTLVFLSSFMADPNCKLDNGYPLIWLACSSTVKNNAILKLLLSFGANPNACWRPLNSAPRPVLFHAIFFDDIQTMRLLLEHGANPNAFVRANDTRNTLCLFEWAMSGNRHAQAQLLLDHGADPKGVAHNGDPLVVNALLFEPIFLEMLIKHKADPNTILKSSRNGKECSLLSSAIVFNKPAHIAVLCKYGARIGSVEVALALRLHDDTACLEALITHGINMNEIFKNNNSLLLEAMDANKPKHFKLLLERGANPNLQLPYGDPFEPGDILFGAAARHSNPEFLKILLGHIGKNAIKRSGFAYHLNLLWIATFSKQSNRVKNLIEHAAKQEQQGAPKK